MNTNDFEPEIGEIFDENKSYYLIAFEPTNTALDGKLRKLAGEGESEGRRRSHTQRLLRARAGEAEQEARQR